MSYLETLLPSILVPLVDTRIYAGEFSVQLHKYMLYIWCVRQNLLSTIHLLHMNHVILSSSEPTTLKRPMSVSQSASGISCFSGS